MTRMTSVVSNFIAFFFFVFWVCWCFGFFFLIYFLGVDLKGDNRSVVVATSLLFQNKEINFLFSFFERKTK